MDPFSGIQREYNVVVRLIQHIYFQEVNSSMYSRAETDYRVLLPILKDLVRT
jgi:hypothetical protein